MRKRRITSSYFDYYYRKFEPFLAKSAGSMASQRADFDDYLAISMAELMNSMIRFDPSVGATLLTWLGNRVSGVLRHAKRSVDRNLRREGLMFNDKINDLKSRDVDCGIKITVEEILSILNDTERSMLKSRFMESMSLKEVESDSNTSRAKVMNVCRLAKERLVENFGENFMDEY